MMSRPGATINSPSTPRFHAADNPGPCLTGPCLTRAPCDSGALLIGFPADDKKRHSKLVPHVAVPKQAAEAEAKVEAAAEALKGGAAAKQGFGRRGKSPPVKLTDVLAALEEVREMKARQNADMQQKIDRLQAEQARRAAR